MPAEDMTALREKLAALEAALQDTEMSPYLHDFIQRRVDTIRAAARVYRVQGARPLKDAMRKVVGDLQVDDKRLRARAAEASDEGEGRAQTGGRGHREDSRGLRQPGQDWQPRRARLDVGEHGRAVSALVLLKGWLKTVTRDSLGWAHVGNDWSSWPCCARLSKASMSYGTTKSWRANRSGGEANVTRLSSR